MKYFIVMEAGGELNPIDSHITFLQNGDTISYNDKKYVVEWKFVDFDRDDFIVCVTPNSH